MDVVKQRDTVYGYIRIYHKGQNVISDIIQIIVQFYLIPLDSVILTDQHDIDLMYNLLSPRFVCILNKDEFKLRLLYRNSRDGNSIESFHRHCDAHRNTLTLVKSNYGNVFGGFTTKYWVGNRGYTKDDEAFLYLIKSKFNHPPKIYNNKNKDNGAICVRPKYAPTWGSAFDLCIGTTTGSIYSHLGVTYEGTGNVLCGGDTDKTNKADHTFKVVDYEVFVLE